MGGLCSACHVVLPCCLSVCSRVSLTADRPVLYLPACPVSRPARGYLSIPRLSAGAAILPVMRPHRSIEGRTQQRSTRESRRAWGSQAGAPSPSTLPGSVCQSSSSSQLLPETRSCHQPPKTSSFLCPEKGSLSPEGHSSPSWSLAPAPWSWGHLLRGLRPGVGPKGCGGSRCPSGQTVAGPQGRGGPADPTHFFSAPLEFSAGASLGSRGKLWERPPQTPRWLQGVLWGNVSHPGLGERALDQAQDDSMRKKCPQEDNLASAAKTTTLVTASFPLSPQWDEQGDARLPGPSRGPQTRGWDPLCVSLCLCLTVSLSPYLSVSMSCYLSHYLCLCLSLSLCLTVSIPHCLSRCLCRFLSGSLHSLSDHTLPL